MKGITIEYKMYFTSIEKLNKARLKIKGIISLYLMNIQAQKLT